MIKTFETNEGQIVTLDVPAESMSRCGNEQDTKPEYNCYKCFGKIDDWCCFGSGKLLHGGPYETRWGKYVISNVIIQDPLPILKY